MTVNGKENKGEDIKNPKLERKEQIEGEDHQIMNQEVEDETDVGLGFTVFKRSPVFPVRVGTLQRRSQA